MLIAHYPLKDDKLDYSLFNNYLLNAFESNITQDVSSGKLGKSYNFDGTGYLKSKNKVRLNKVTYSAWIYNTRTSGQISIVGNLNSDGTNGGNSMMYIEGNKLGIRVPNRSTTSNSNGYVSSVATVPVNIWTHVAVSIDIPQGIVKFYINGAYCDTKNIAASDLPVTILDLEIIVGQWSPSYLVVNYFSGKMNDVRVYDEVLTDKAIREIHKTCILNYSFNDPYAQPITNIYTGTQYNYSNSILTYAFETDKFKKYGFDTALRIAPPTTYAVNNMAYSYLINPALFATGKTYTCVFYAYNSADCNTDIRLHLEGSFTLIANSVGSNNGALVNNVKDSVQLIWVTFVATNTVSPAKIMFYPNPNTAGLFTTGYQLFAGIQIYEGNCVIPPSPFGWNGIIDDISDFGNNGQILPDSNPKWSSTSKLGLGCYEFNSAQKIDIRPDVFGTSVNEMSISAWVKVTAMNASGVTTPIIHNWNTWAVGAQKGFALRSLYGTSWSFTLCDGTNYRSIDSVSAPSPGVWQHIVATFKDGNTKIYIDGELDASQLLSGTNIVFEQTTSYIGYGKINTGYFNGYIDDVQIYMTELTASDVKSLYESRFNLDSNGDLYAYSLIEDHSITSPNFTDSGVVKCNVFDELGIFGMDYKELDDGSQWAKIFHHRNRLGTVLFASNEEAMDIQTEDKYSKLYLLDKFRASDGKFEMMIEYPEDLIGYNRWKQTSNPTVVTTPHNGVTGYTPVSITWTSNGWGGLEYAGNQTLIDGMTKNVGRYYAIGAQWSWGAGTSGIPGIPGPSDSVQYVELWVRVDTVPIINDKLRLTDDGIVMAHKLKEK